MLHMNKNIQCGFQNPNGHLLFGVNPPNKNEKPDVIFVTPLPQKEHQPNTTNKDDITVIINECKNFLQTIIIPI